MININESLKIIAKLKVYEKILKATYVDLAAFVKDDEEIIDEINEEIRQFLAAKVNQLLNKQPSGVPANAPTAVVPGVPMVDNNDYSMSNPLVAALMQKHGFDPTLPVENRVAIMKAVKDEFMASKKAEVLPPPVGDPAVVATWETISEHKRALDNLFGK